VAEHPSFAIAAGRRLTPRGEETDGFYVAELIKSQIVD
jgi:hypothetical protein